MLLRTGWSKRKGSDYINLKEDGLSHPRLDKECSQFLAQERDILGVGVETVGTDAGKAVNSTRHSRTTFYVRQRKFGLASLTNLDQLPPTGAIVIAAPLKIVKAPAAPCA